jgi:hypothetical protein
VEWSGGYRLVVIFRQKDGKFFTGFTNDADLILGLFAKAAKKETSVGRGEDFNRIWNEKPPALGEPRRGRDCQWKSFQEVIDRHARLVIVRKLRRANVQAGGTCAFDLEWEVAGTAPLIRQDGLCIS